MSAGDHSSRARGNALGGFLPLITAISCGVPDHDASQVTEDTDKPLLDIHGWRDRLSFGKRRTRQLGDYGRHRRGVRLRALPADPRFQVAVSTLSPFLYTQIIWVTIINIVVFDQFQGSSILGAAIVISKAVYRQETIERNAT